MRFTWVGKKLFSFTFLLDKKSKQILFMSLFGSPEVTKKLLMPKGDFAQETGTNRG